MGNKNNHLEYTNNLMSYRKEQSQKWHQVRIPDQSMYNERFLYLEKHFEQLSAIIVDASKADNIIKVSLVTATFCHILHDIMDSIVEFDQKNVAIEKILELNTVITKNPHTIFDVRNKKNYESNAHIKIFKNISEMFEMLGCNPNIIDCQIMDTSLDEEFARLLDFELNFSD
jgi:diaminopimelate epimerase